MKKKHYFQRNPDGCVFSSHQQNQGVPKGDLQSRFLPTIGGCTPKSNHFLTLFVYSYLSSTFLRLLAPTDVIWTLPRAITPNKQTCQEHCTTDNAYRVNSGAGNGKKLPICTANQTSNKPARRTPASSTGLCASAFSGRPGCLAFSRASLLLRGRFGIVGLWCDPAGMVQWVS